MNNSWLQFAKDETSKPAVSGQWFVIRFMPDNVTGEIFNIGIVFIDDKEHSHYKLIENANAFKCLFGDLGVSNISFMLENLKEVLENNHYNISPSPHIIYSSRQTAKGDTVEDILDDLFNSMITLICHGDEDEDKNNERKSISTQKVRTDVFREMKKRYPHDFEKAYRKEPFFMRNPENQREIMVDMPIAYYTGRESELRQDYYGSIVSAAYLSPVHRVHQINYVGVTNVSNICELLGKNEIAKAALIIYKPEENKIFDEKYQIETDYELDKCLYSLHQLSKDGFDIKIDIQSTEEACLESAMEFIHS